MLGRRVRAPSGSDGNAADRVLTLAVFYRSDSVEQHLADLGAAGGIGWELIRKGTEWTVPPESAGVLWELTLDDGAHRLVTSITSQLPAVSYSAAPNSGLAELSRSLG